MEQPLGTQISTVNRQKQKIGAMDKQKLKLKTKGEFAANGTIKRVKRQFKEWSKYL